MKQKSNIELLRDEIRLLESKQDYEFQVLSQQFHKTVDGLKPLNLIGNTLKGIVKSPATGNSLLNNTVGIVSGFLTKKLLLGSSANPIKRGLGTLLQFGISNIVYKNSFAIQAVAGTILQKIFSKKEKSDEQLDSIEIIDPAFDKKKN